MDIYQNFSKTFYIYKKWSMKMIFMLYFKWQFDDMQWDIIKWTKDNWKGKELSRKKLKG